MARFYFNIFNDDITIDEEGIDCFDLETAKARAIIEARILACDTIMQNGRFD